MAEKVLLRYFIERAYGVKPFQLLGGPAWINSAHYDIEATAGGTSNAGDLRVMMQKLLEERFNLKVHHETKQLPVYELTMAKGGTKLPEPKDGTCTEPDPNAPSGPPLPGGPIPCGRVLIMMSPACAQMHGAKVSMAQLIAVLSNAFGQTVVDKTGFTRTFDMHLEFTPDDTLAGIPRPPSRAPSDRSPGPAPATDLHGNIFSAIQEQLGLKLESAKGQVDVLVIDSVERPSAN